MIRGELAELQCLHVELGLLHGGADDGTLLGGRSLDLEGLTLILDGGLHPVVGIVSHETDGADGLDRCVCCGGDGAKDGTASGAKGSHGDETPGLGACDDTCKGAVGPGVRIE